MTHCPAMEEMNAMIDGELLAEKELELRWHLDICEPCGRLCAALVALKCVVGRARQCETPSPTLRRSVMTNGTLPPR